MIDYADPKRLPPESPPARAARASLTALWQVGLAVGLLAMIVAATWAVLAAPVAVVFGLLAAIVMVVAARLAQTARQRQAMIVLGHVQTIIRTGMPLAPSLRVWQSAESRAVARQLTHVAHALEDGSSVSDALLAARVDLPWRVLDRLSSAEHAGRLVPAITEIVADERRRRAADPIHWPLVKVYALVLMIVVPAIMLILAIFVMPRYQQILRDFKMPVPPVMRWTIALASGVAPIIGVLGVVLFVTAAQFAIAQFARPTHLGMSHRGLIRLLIDRVRWTLPIVGAMVRDRGLADVMLTVAESLDACRPLDLAIAEAQQPHLNAILAECVGNWAHLIAAGAAPGTAAAQAGLPRLVWGMLGSARDVPNIAAVCHFLARHYRSRFSRSEALVRESAVPLIALCGGAATLLVALAIFQPMVVIIDSAFSGGVRP